MVEVSQELAQKVFGAVEVARKTGKIKKGSNEVTKAIERGKAKLVVIANDASPKEVVMHIPIICKEKQVPCVNISSKQELGAAAGIEVSTVAVVIVDEGDAKKIISEIAQSVSNL
ncbi:MAG: 50S ribosomal protein L7Ae [Candidatus Woesearchaeota archaeon]|jgi:large subunit ribosomal protein L7Ae